MANFTIWLIVGGIIGWVAGYVMAKNAQEGRLQHVVVGTVPLGAEVDGTQTRTSRRFSA